MQLCYAQTSKQYIAVTFYITIVCYSSNREIDTSISRSDTSIFINQIKLLTFFICMYHYIYNIFIFYNIDEIIVPIGFVN